ncbi:MAG: M23 family metallopeptidase, partial [Elusimicrobiota bacterium]
HTDYWITKADNMVIRARMGYMVSEFDKSRDALQMARNTDSQLRSLLGMRQEAQPSRASGVGGGSPADRLGLLRLSAADPGRIPQQAIRNSVVELRKESEKRLASFQEIAWFITNQRSLLRSTPSIWPASGQLTSSFGYRFSPFRRYGSEGHSGHIHAGIDVANRPETPIVATADGVVRHSGWSGGYGIMVLVDHGFGYTTLYGHASKTTVRAGERVQRGQLIGYMGTSGRSTGNHLHYEVWVHERPVNPLKYLQVRSEEK